MATSWLICDYHGTKTYDNPPVNLSLVETFEIHKENYIKFMFQNNKPVVWKFENDATRNLEYRRINELIKKAF